MSSKKLEKRTLVCDGLDGCGAEFTVDANSFKVSKYKDSDGDILYVKYFKCPECHKEYIISVDLDFTLKDEKAINAKQIELRNKLQKINRLQQQRKNASTLRQEYISDFEKVRALVTKLKSDRKVLMREYRDEKKNGTLTYIGEE